MPDFGPADTVREDPVRKGLLFAGTENSVWVSFDDGDHWQSLQLNLPHTSMRDLWIHDDDLIVATHGRGFWILDDIAPLRETSASIANAPHLFAPAPAYRVKRDTYTDTPMPPDEPTAANPPDGAMIDYFLPAAAKSVTIEVLDGQNQLVRKFSSSDKPEMSDEELRKQLIPLYWVRPFHSLSTDAGMHRWVWDLHHAAPTSTRHDYPIAAIPHDTPRSPFGPTVLPGKYTVRLTVDDKPLTSTVTVKMDPRVKTSSDGLEKKFRTEVQLSTVIRETAQALLEGNSIRAQIEKLKSTNLQTKETVEQFGKKMDALVGPQGGPPAQQTSLTAVNGNAETVYQAVWQVDAAPTSAQLEALSGINRDSGDLLKRWKEFKATDLPSLNTILRGMKVPEIDPRAEFKLEEVDIDEE